MPEVKVLKNPFKVMTEHNITDLGMELAGEKITIRRQQTAQVPPQAGKNPRAPSKGSPDPPEMTS